jgi:hypothetical protein
MVMVSFLRLVGQDTAFSMQQHGFESHRKYFGLVFLYIVKYLRTIFYGKTSADFYINCFILHKTIVDGNIVFILFLYK